ncbi:MAG: response regulator [Pseudomonadota bacterium]
MSGKILLVDDTASNRLLMATSLKAEGYHVVEAADGLAAVGLAQSEQPDVILLDVLMPEIDGFETCRMLKQDPRSFHIPVVMVTALGERQHRIHGLEAGADDFLSKPYDEVALLARVQSLIRMKRTIDRLMLPGRDTPPPGLLAPELGAARMLIIWAAGEARSAVSDAVQKALGRRPARAGAANELHAVTAEQTFDLFLIGPTIDGANPVEIASLLRANPATRDVPIVMVLPQHSQTRAYRVLDMGVADYVTDPPDPEELIARLRLQLRRKLLTDRLRAEGDAGPTDRGTDPLTGLATQTRAMADLGEALRAGAGAAGPVAVLSVDIDRLDPINKAYGIAAGDAVVVAVAARLRESLDGPLQLGRIGGEEFLAILPGTDLAAAQARAETARKAVAATPVRLPGPAGELMVTVSVGVAIGGPRATAEDVLKRSLIAAAEAKDRGRDRVSVAAEPG